MNNSNSMYMSLPSRVGEKDFWNHNTNRSTTSLEKILSSLENKLSSAEYSKLWQELLHSGKDLDELYEESRSGTFLFKEKYDDIKKTQQLNDALRQTYYFALAEKKKHEEDRDNYFRCEEELVQLKEGFIEETQGLALKTSKYIEYNQRFALKREQFVTRLIADVNKVNEENNKLATDKQRLNKELSECRTNIYDLKEKIKVLEDNQNLLNANCQNLEQKRNQLKKEAEWMLRQNNKLKESNSRFEQEIAEANSRIEILLGEQRNQKEKEKMLWIENAQLLQKCEQTHQVAESLKLQMIKVKAEAEKQKESCEKEVTTMKNEVAVQQKRLEAARANNHRTIIRNQQLRERLSSAKHKIGSVTRDKDRSTLKEFRTRKTNAELATYQLELINEVLELKNDFFRDQTRIREGAKLNRKLEKNIAQLRHQMYLMKENPSAIDPLDGAKELKKETRQKFRIRATS